MPSAFQHAPLDEISLNHLKFGTLLASHQLELCSPMVVPEQCDGVIPILRELGGLAFGIRDKANILGVVMLAGCWNMLRT